MYKCGAAALLCPERALSKLPLLPFCSDATLNAGTFPHNVRLELLGFLGAVTGGLGRVQVAIRRLAVLAKVPGTLKDPYGERRGQVAATLSTQTGELQGEVIRGYAS